MGKNKEIIVKSTDKTKELEKEKDKIMSKIVDLEKNYSSLNLLDEEYDELKKPLDEKVKKINEDLNLKIKNSKKADEVQSPDLIGPFLYALFVGSVMAFLAPIFWWFFFYFFLIAYFPIGFVFGRYWPRPSWKWGILITVPLFIITFVSYGNSSGEGQIFFEGIFLFGFLIVFLACIGASMGARVARKKEMTTVELK